MANRLRNLKVDYVSMVPRPANQQAVFVLAKHDPTPTPSWRQVLKATSIEDVQERIRTLLNPVVVSSPYVGSATDYSYVVDTYPDYVIVKREDNDNDGDGGYWRIAYTVTADGNVTLGEAIQVEQTYTPISNAGAQETTMTTATTEKTVQKTEAPVEKAETVTISKAELVALQDQNTQILKALEEQTAARQTAEAVAKAEQDARELTSAIAKAEKDLPALPGATSTEVGTLLRDVSKSVTPEVYGRLEAILLAANAAVAKGELFKEAGASHSGTEGGNSAMDQLQAVAKGLIEKDPELTPSKSIAKAMTLRPDLVKLDRKERGFARD